MRARSAVGLVAMVAVVFGVTVAVLRFVRSRELAFGVLRYRPTPIPLAGDMSVGMGMRSLAPRSRTAPEGAVGLEILAESETVVPAGRPVPTEPPRLSTVDSAGSGPAPAAVPSVEFVAPVPAPAALPAESVPPSGASSGYAASAVPSAASAAFGGSAASVPSVGSAASTDPAGPLPSGSRAGRGPARLPILAAALMLVAAGFLGAAAYLAPASPDHLTGRDVGVVELRVDKPDVEVGVVLDASRVGESATVPVYVVADVAEDERLHWRLVSHGVSLSADSAGGTLTRTLEGTIVGPTERRSDVADRSFDIGAAGAPVAYLIVADALVTAGSQVGMQLPAVVLGRDPAQVDTAWQDSTPWFDPEDGFVAAVAPRALGALRTVVSTPREDRDGLWLGERRLAVEWSGVDPVVERREQRYLLAAGLALGLAGAAMIAALQESARVWRRGRLRRRIAESR